MDPYKVLGLTNDASIDEVIKTYRELAKKYHPDLAKNDDEKQYLLSIFQNITNAYNQIKNSHQNTQTVFKTQIDSDYAKYLLFKAEDFLNKNEIDNAINTLKILQKTQKNTKIYFLLGKAYMAKGYYKQAIDYYRKTLEYENYNVEALLGLANCYERIGLKNTAKKVYQEILEWEPNNKIALNKLIDFEKKQTLIEKLLSGLGGKKNKKFTS
ncbi:DnaJ domain-containing protein [Desulfurella sp.]|uniref:J domain-containing protein n=1 Tax=Desulfurella sp. TaxID=1962857 RepID=UPI0025BD3467|nr:DnaJ domain-containing protein [Desulfurella sp.]